MREEEGTDRQRTRNIITQQNTHSWALSDSGIRCALE